MCSIRSKVICFKFSDKLSSPVKILKAKGLWGSILLILSKFYQQKIKNYGTYLKYFYNKSGLEIGGPSKIFKSRSILPLYPIISNLDGCNFSETTAWEGRIKSGMTYHYHKNNEKGRQFICEATDISALQSRSYDFILASHVIEHIANPLKAMSEWLKVLKQGGALLIVVPDKSKTFDHNRKITSFSHLKEDFEKDTKEDNLSHLPEILELHDLALDPAAGNFEFFRERSLDNLSNRCLHHHVFDTPLLIEIFNFFKLNIISIDTALPFHIIILGEK